jgi:aminoglycoside phosphotransferase (APT) family kinase protein
VQKPAAEVAIDAELVAMLVRAQHPDLDGPLTLVGSGWDNTLYRLGDELCVRLPRRRLAADLVVNEQRWLPSIAARVRVPIPVPLRTGEATGYYPWPWTICRWLAGEPASGVAAPDRGAIAPGLAAFLTDLHVPAPDDAPRNPVRGVPLARRTDAVRERLASGLIPHSGALLALWDRLLAVPDWTGPPLWLHGDPHPANLLLQTGGGQARLAAVLDFGDLTCGDPASDIAAAWLVFDESARAVFRKHLTGLDSATWQRARGWALNIGTAIAVSSDDSPQMAAIGAHALDQVLLAE